MSSHGPTVNAAGDSAATDLNADMAGIAALVALFAVAVALVDQCGQTATGEDPQGSPPMPCLTS